jgi:signal transduction histidine kinase
VWADTQQLRQVLINLVQNAADGIGREGTITLSARQGASAAGRGAKAMVRIEVADDGAGIPPEVEPRLFDPFFSTKEGGTGLGLPIAARILEKHGGIIEYVTHPGRGTTFSIVLPKESDHGSEDPSD